MRRHGSHDQTCSKCGKKSSCDACCNPARVGCDQKKSPYFIPLCREDARRRPSRDPGDCSPPTTEEDGILIKVDDIGEDIKGTIVFVPGFGSGGRELFDPQLNDLSRRGYRVITYDPRGNGESDKPFDGVTGSYSLDQAADDLRELLDCLDVDCVTLVAFSGGSQVALHYVARHCCAHVAKLVLASAGLNPPLSDAAFQALLDSYQADKPLADSVLLALALAPNFTPQATHPNEFIAGQININRTPTYVNWEQLTIAQNSLETLTADAAKVCVPTLLINGLLDAGLAPVSGAFALQAAIPGSELVFFEDSGHAVNIVDPTRFNDLVAGVTVACNTPCCDDHDSSCC